MTDRTTRQPVPEDAQAIAAINMEGLASGHASFREAPYDWSEFTAGFMTKGGIALVLEHNTSVLAWAGISPTSARKVYRGVGEASVYVSSEQQNLGVGRQLMEALVMASESAGYWTLVAQIFPENKASLSLHKAVGFHVVGTREKLGQMTYGPYKGLWRDVVLLERRSTRIGCTDPDA